jgi:hypothetical protein
MRYTMLLVLHPQWVLAVRRPAFRIMFGDGAQYTYPRAGRWRRELNSSRNVLKKLELNT